MATDASATSQTTQSSRQRLIVFTRYPEAGKSKTRLIGALGPQGAADVQREMTRHTLRQAEELVRRTGVSVEVHFAGGDEGLMRQCFGDRFPYVAQGGGDLGRRMQLAFREAWQADCGQAVLIGADCPGTNADVIETAFDRLQNHDVVLGPATDGGYYLIGLRREIPQLFERIPWGGSAVLSATLRAAEESGVSVSLLEPLADVDRPEDLDLWNSVRERSPADSAEPRISIIVPVLNEADHLDDALRSAQDGDNVETIVVDGGSRDSTVQIAEARGARVLSAEQGRAHQMNAGAAAATGRILLFLHADTRLPSDFDRQVRSILARPGVVAGAFRLRIDGRPTDGRLSRSLRLIQRIANLRAKYLQMPYGDQAVFLRTETFEAIGGFPSLPIMEDYELIRRLRRRGRIAIAAADVVTSARSWEKRGPWRTTWRNQMAVLGYYLRVSPDRLAAWYRGNCDNA